MKDQDERYVIRRPEPEWSKPHPGRGGRWRFAGWAFVVLGVFMMIVAGVEYMAGLSVQDWQTTTGEIVDTEVFSWGKNGGRYDVEHEYFVKITYEYSVDGTSYSNDRYGIGTGWLGRKGPWYGPFDTREQAEQSERELPPGRSLTIHFDPKQPSNSSLSVEYDPFLDDLWPGVVVLVVGVALAFYHSPKRRRERP